MKEYISIKDFREEVLARQRFSIWKKAFLESCKEDVRDLQKINLSFSFHIKEYANGRKEIDVDKVSCLKGII